MVYEKYGQWKLSERIPYQRNGIWIQDQLWLQTCYGAWGKSETRENQGWEKLCPSAIVLSYFSHLIDIETKVQR